MGTQYALSSFLTLLVSGLVVGCASSQPLNGRLGAQEDTSSVALDTINFRVDPGFSVVDLWNSLDITDVQIARVETVYLMGDREWFDTLYFPVGESPEELEDEILQNRKSTWLDLLAGDWLDEEADQYHAATAFVQTPDDQLEPSEVFSVMLVGATDVLVQQADRLSIDSQAMPLSVMRERIEQDESSIMPVASAPSDETWVPESGDVKTGSSTTSGYRYVTQKLKWDDKSGFASSGNYSTYEHEFMLYNYSGGSYAAGTYLGETSTAWPNCYPSLYSNSHNFPSSAYAYLDTRLTGTGTCPSHFDELEFTFGLVFASEVSANTSYTVTMTVANGTTSTDEFKLQGDIGKCSKPTSTCASWLTWGVYSHNLQERIQPDSSGTWDTTVPGTKSWTE